jgi:4-hydroxybenzoate polyprenyltransferase
MSVVPNTRPLVVDLDGTLLRSDMLLEAAFSLLRHHPARLLPALGWLRRGKSHLKAQLAHAVALDVTTLPYNQPLLAFLAQQKAAGRTLVLATASHQQHADAVARHLGLFDRVFASSTDLNLSSQHKQGVLVDAYGERGFDYIGNSHDDLVVWASSCNAYLADPEWGVEQAASRLGNVQGVFSTAQQGWRIWARQLRLHQWAKNVLLFVPLLAAHQAGDIALLARGVLAFVAFGLCASSVYLLNDLLDLQDDRRQAKKQLRPLASGAVRIKTAVMLLPALLMAAFALSAWLLPWQFTLMLAAYYGLTLAYSLVLKRIMTVDVIALAMLYTLRIIAGAGALGVGLTFWMLAFSMFLFLSLALVKRYAELHGSQAPGQPVAVHGRGYYGSDLHMLATLGAASGYLSVMVLALYIQDPATAAHYRHPQLIWLACPLLLYWITRTWMVTHRGWMHDDPVVFALKDRNSILTGLLFGAVFWLAL